ncbi:hypothetical protein BD289DRAFT_166628 [Coniella lustricola]|uniref:Uncharacterized protein n=1 Tax=Coniella lustricola TaxID=2025994 RepID=A0A2T3AE66_9PEZI|nr:hypothetical protein BD289DRAFT_166628 [Coniella lustricola]
MLCLGFARGSQPNKSQSDLTNWVHPSLPASCSFPPLSPPKYHTARGGQVVPSQSFASPQPGSVPTWPLPSLQPLRPPASSKVCDRGSARLLPGTCWHLAGHRAATARSSTCCVPNSRCPCTQAPFSSVSIHFTRHLLSSRPTSSSSAASLRPLSTHRPPPGPSSTSPPPHSAPCNPELPTTCLRDCRNIR